MADACTATLSEWLSIPLTGDPVRDGLCVGGHPPEAAHSTADGIFHWGPSPQRTTPTAEQLRAAYYAKRLGH